MKTIEIFATDNAGSVGNIVTFSFNLNPPTQLVFATQRRAARDGAGGPELRGAPNAGDRRRRGRVRQHRRPRSTAR